MTDFTAYLRLGVDSRDAVQAQKDLDKMSVSGDKSEKSFKGLSNTSKLLGASIGGIGLSAATAKVIDYSDAWTNVENVLIGVSDTAAAYAVTQAKVLSLSKDTFSSLQGTAGLYSEITRSVSELGINQERVLGVTRTINNLFLAGGKAASETAGAIRQLNQGLASGALRGDEFNSVAEGAPRILDALSQKLNITKGELRDFAATGGITAELLISALEDYSGEAQRAVDTTTRTFSQSAELARTIAIEYAGASDAIKQFTAGAGAGLVLVAENIDLIADAAALAAVIFGARFTGSIVASTVALVAQNAAAMRSTVTINAMAAASRVAGASMALLGGPAGVALLAGAAIYYFATRASEAEKILQGLNPEVDGLAERFAALGMAQKELARNELANQIIEQKKEISELANTLKMYEAQSAAVKASGGTVFEKTIQETLEVSARLEDAQGKLASLQGQFDAVKTPDGQIQGFIDKISGLNEVMGYFITGNSVATFSMIPSTAAAEVEKVSEAYAKLSYEIQKQIDLKGDESESASLAYDIQKGAIKDITAAEAKKLVILHKTKDAMDAHVEKTKELEDAEKSRAESVAALLTGMEREIALINDSSKEAAILYDITNGIIKAKGDEAAQLLETARALDIANAAYKEQEELLSMLDEFDYGGSFDNLEGQAKEATGAIGNMFERIDQQASDMWVGMFDGFDGMLDGLQDLFTRTLAEMAHEAITKPIILNIQQGGSGLSGIGAGLASPAGMIAAGAIVGSALISEWNASMEKGFTELTSEYKQANQSTGTLLASGNEKSQSIANSISQLEGISGDALDVNRQMLSALNNISDGIGKASAVFGRSGIEGPEVGGLGKTTLNKDVAGLGLFGAGYIVSEVIGGQFGAFIDGVIGGVSKAIYSKSKSVIDSGIEFTGQALADILAGGAVDALSYATVQTKKKVLGITTSNKSSTETEALTGDLTTQLGLVFESAGTTLGIAAEAFGLDFDSYINKLIIDPQKLSLKDLSGDELTAEIEAFFSSTLDNWAGVLADGSVVLNQFQQVGEGAFETVIRLASELNQFNSYADALNLNFGLAGFAAVEASQNIAKAAGGFDQLNNSMAGYYSNFFDDSERAERQMGLLSSALGEIGIDAVPSSREAFRSLVEGIDLATEAGQQQFGALINLQGVFAELVPATEALTESSRSAADIATERLGLERELLTLQGDTAALRKLDKDALHESNRALYDQINALEAMKEISDEVRSLEQQYFELTASEAEKRNALIQSLLSDEARTIQENIYAWYDAQEAASAAAKAVEDAAQSMRAMASGAFDSLGAAIGAERARIESIVSAASEAKSALDASIANEKTVLDSAHNEKISMLTAQANAEKEANQAINAARIESLKEEAGAVTSRIGGLKSLFEQLTDAAEGSVVGSISARRRAAEFEIDTALRNAQAGRGVPVDGSLTDAITTLRDNPASLYTSAQEMAYASAVTQNKLSELAGFTSAQLTTEEKTLTALEAQIASGAGLLDVTTTSFDALITQANQQYENDIAALDAMKSSAQAQFDKLTGIDTGTLSVESALVAFNESLLAADFENAQEQYGRLDGLLEQGQLQLNTLLDIDSGVLSLRDAIDRFADAVAAADQDKANTELLAEMKRTADQLTQLREEQRIQALAQQVKLNETARNTLVIATPEVV